VERRTRHDTVWLNGSSAVGTQTAGEVQWEQLAWHGQLPVLGAPFGSSGFQEQETDLVIIVTRHLVRPAKPGQPLRTPWDSSKPSNDMEFFLLGKLEVDRDMQRRFAEGAGVIGPYGHIIELQPEKRYVKKKVVKP
jgi:pilus assembly protein CpaC